MADRLVAFKEEGNRMFIIGLILLILGIVLAIPVLLWIGVILLVLGLLFWFGPAPVGGRRWY